MFLLSFCYVQFLQERFDAESLTSAFPVKNAYYQDDTNVFTAIPDYMNWIFLLFSDSFGIHRGFLKRIRTVLRVIKCRSIFFW